MGDRKVPYGAFNFTVSFDGDDSAFGGFSDVSGLSTEFTMAEYREGNDARNHVRKIPMVFKSGDVTLKRGIINSRVLWEWVTNIRQNGPSGRKDTVKITLHDEARQPVQSWVLRTVTPMKVTGPTLAAKGGGDVAMEELVLSVEALDMDFP